MHLPSSPQLLKLLLREQTRPAPQCPALRSSCVVMNTVLMMHASDSPSHASQQMLCLACLPGTPACALSWSSSGHGCSTSGAAMHAQGSPSTGCSILYPEAPLPNATIAANVSSLQSRVLVMDGWIDAYTTLGCVRVERYASPCPRAKCQACLHPKVCTIRVLVMQAANAGTSSSPAAQQQALAPSSPSTTASSSPPPSPDTGSAASPPTSSAGKLLLLAAWAWK